MADDKKEELIKNAPGAVESTAPAKAEKKDEGGPAKERPSNCAGCKKSIKNKRWYYRNGSYYCTKRCWSVATKKPQKTEEAPK